MGQEVKEAAERVTSTEFDREVVHKELRSLRVAELRTQLASRNIRWGNMVEKEELVQALLNAMEEAHNFSSSGALTPGKVGDLTDQELRKQLDSTSNTPLLLDIYATWCGPCQIMTAQLDLAAQQFGDKVRLVKLDSDKYSFMAGSLQTQGLPTLILFDKNGKEISRREGALMKDALVNWIEEEALS